MLPRGGEGEKKGIPPHKFVTMFIRMPPPGLVNLLLSWFSFVCLVHLSTSAVRHGCKGGRHGGNQPPTAENMGP